MKRIFLIQWLLCLSLTLCAAKAPTDEQLKDFCRTASAAMMSGSSDEARQTAFDAATARLSAQADIHKLSAPQVTLLFEYGGLSLDKYLRVWLEDVFEARSSDPIFAYFRWRYMPENDGFTHGDKETHALIAFLSTRQLQQTIDAYPDVVSEVLSALATMKDANWHTPGFASGVARLLQCRLSDSAAMDCVKAFNSVARVDTLDYDSREQIRVLCRQQYESLRATLESPRKQKACEAQIKYLDGPFACGNLVGSPAPELHFLRVMKAGKTSDQAVEILDAATLQAFRGKVVMLDFWGTKCAPCLKAFPELAELQHHFEGREVVILGVTSLQGYFVDTPHQRTIQCRGDEEKELSLFPDYMKGMGISWTIGISKEDVMNTDYGALAIPHVVIIDKDGIVRHNAVNGDKETKIRLIESLL